MVNVGKAKGWLGKGQSDGGNKKEEGKEVELPDRRMEAVDARE